MALFGRRRARREAAFKAWAQRAAAESKQARDYAAEAAMYREQLRNSSDPAADRYLLRQAEAFQGIAEANARDYRRAASNALKWG